MDLSQSKLTKSEWLSIEVAVPDSEKQVLQLIMAAYTNPDYHTNDTQSILTHLKIPNSEEMNNYIFGVYFKPIIQSVSHDHAKSWLKGTNIGKTKKPNKADMIRIDNMSAAVGSLHSQIYEFVLLDHANSALVGSNNTYHVYSLVQLLKNSVANVNPIVMDYIHSVLAFCNPDSPESVANTFEHASEYIEKNPGIIKYADKELYPHQKQLFRIFNNRESFNTPKLVLYMAPTGTGKTLSPIGLSQNYRIIFVCVARHVGLALAKSAISVGKKVAFAFGCETAADIRLHYFAAVDYKINKRSGGIGKVDNSAGQKVEIIISDVASYLVAMRYMLSFNSENQIITYWDEPTITMDYETHDLHETIHNNWSNNKISKVVLSCATLPKQWEIQTTIDHFKAKFHIFDDEEDDIEPEIISIDSFDCKKTLSLLDKRGLPVLPHTLFSQYNDILRCVEHCEQNKSLLRYFDVDEIVRFVHYVCEKYTVEEKYRVVPYFKRMENITMLSIKQYYLKFLANLNPDEWNQIYVDMSISLTPKLGLKKETTMRKFASQQSPSSKGGGELRRTTSVAATPTEPQTRLTTAGVMITTQDAYTLTDGPTIFLAEDVDKIGLFYLQQANIPEKTFNSLLERIEKNNVVQRRISALEKELEDKEAAATGDAEKTKKLEREGGASRETGRILEQLEGLRRELQSVSLPAKYVPNTIPHQETWLPVGYEKPKSLFVPSIDESDVRDIMGLGVSNTRKLLLIMGIGVFNKATADNDGRQVMAEVQYMEVMKRLAIDRRLFLIIASSDYIYGTNYQFSHGFIGKDLDNMTQQKTIQAIGRVGRTNVQQDYTIRFRDDALLTRLFLPAEKNLEAEIMRALFSE